MPNAADRSWKASGIVIVLAVLLMPGVGLLFVARNHKPSFHQEYLPLLIIGFVFVFVIFVVLYAANRDHWTVLSNELKYLIQHGKYATLIGSALGLIAIAIYLILPSDSTAGAQRQDFERVAAALSLYFGIVGGALGIHTLYLKAAPITEMHELLEMIADDLIRYRTHGNKVLIVFPALNIGYYRELTRHPPRSEHQDSIPDNHPYKRYRAAFIESCGTLKNDVRIVTYSPGSYDQIYQAYTAEKDAKGPTIIGFCAKEADQLFKQVCACDGEAYGVEPKQNRLPPHVIVIGPVSYLMSSFGMPKYNGSSNAFELKEKSVATLLAYRREDAGFAALIWREVNEELVSAGHRQHKVSVSSQPRAPNT
jgi:hypothetical protein